MLPWTDLLASLDEALFALPNVINFQVDLHRGRQGDALQVTLFTNQNDGHAPLRAAAVLGQVPAIREALSNNTLVLAPVLSENGWGPAGSTVKRKIVDQRT